MRKLLLIISLIILIVTTFSSAYDVRGVEELSYVLAIGLDISDSEKEPLLLTLQIVKPAPSGENSTKITTEIKTVKSNSFNLGIAMLNLENTYELNLSHCSAIVISEELATLGFESFISTISNNVEIRPTCNVLISSCNAKDFLETASHTDDISAKFYNSFINSAKNTSYVTPCNLSSFFASTKNDVKEPLAIYSYIKNGTIESLGLAVFKDYKMVGRLSGIDTLCYNILTNALDRATIEIYNPNFSSVPMTLNISKSDNSKIKVFLENEKPVAECQVFVEAKLLSSSNGFDLSNEQNQKLLKSEIEKFFTYNMNVFLYKTSKEYKSDIIGFKGYFNRNFLTR